MQKRSCALSNVVVVVGVDVVVDDAVAVDVGQIVGVVGIIALVVCGGGSGDVKL